MHTLLTVYGWGLFFGFFFFAFRAGLHRYEHYGFGTILYILGSTVFWFGTIPYCLGDDLRKRQNRKSGRLL